ncbi:MAG TPA: energy transducer TonB [Mucilaginibacter sp.]|jgi:TonB family protein|nr:energy transducer TonB [Mucilaginibacter sp.]
MKRLPLLILILVSGRTLAQTEKVTHDVRAKGIKEKFYVLKSDTNIKEGPYAAYPRYGSKVLCEGFYKNNSRDSIWSSYDHDGKLEVKYDYTHKKLLAYDPPKYLKEITQFNVISGADTLKTRLDQPPVLMDGTGKLIRLYVAAIRYPAEAREKNIQGKVIIGITIDTMGHATNYRIKKFIGGGCDQEALRVVKLIDGDWLPGKLNGKVVTCEYDLPLSFTLQQD